MEGSRGELERFSQASAHWFSSAFPNATKVQLEAWDSISDGNNTLVVAPTGSGKTLAAFMWAIDRIISKSSGGGGDTREEGVDAPEGSADTPEEEGVQVLYISPLKALGVDVERNLQAPLVGIREAARNLGVPVPEVSVGVRSGDTPPNERRRLVKHPPDILITTPESLYLMLTSDAAKILRTVTTVIVDEIHALAPTKRGTHLALSLERLEMLTQHPVQRIGLSATVRPVQEIARFLGGDRPVTVVAPKSKKHFDITVEVPVEDMSNPPAAPPEMMDASSTTAEHRVGSMWPAIEKSLYDRIMSARSTIVFANSRRLAERLTSRLNAIYSEEMSEASRDETEDIELARAHHGSISKEVRKRVEEQLKSGHLRCVVATSSLELGIDMGAVDQVIQIDPPPSVISGLQRLGRSGHQVGGVPKAVFYPTHRSKLVETAAIVQGMQDGEIETLSLIENALDVLAQQTIAASSVGDLGVDDWYRVVRRSAPYSDLPRSAYIATLDLVSGKYPSSEFANLRARVNWDRHNDVLEGRPGSKRLAVTQGGTIPDRGLYRVVIAGDRETSAESVRVGELDEEMVYETRVGEVFALGTTSWRVRGIGKDKVEVVPAFGVPGKMPFWRGDSPSRPASLGVRIGDLASTITKHLEGGHQRQARAILGDLGFDDNAVSNTLAYLSEQVEECGFVPNARELLVEQTKDDVGDWRLILESPYGMAVHGPWALAINARIQEQMGADGQAVPSNDGIIVRVSDTSDEPPGAELFRFDPEEILQIVTSAVEGSALFASRFRECAGRALILGGGRPGTRTPLWQQRQRSARLLEVAARYPNFPVILETLRECLNDVYDMSTLQALMADIASRRVRLAQVKTDSPGPYARSLLFGYVGEFMYQGDSPLGERRIAALSVDPRVLQELLGDVELSELLEAEALIQVEGELQHTADGWKMVGEEGLVDLLRSLGPLTEDEVEQRIIDYQPALLTAVIGDRRAFRTRINGVDMVAAVEDAGLLVGSLGVAFPQGAPSVFSEIPDDPTLNLVRRYTQTHGPFLPGDLSARYGLSKTTIDKTLKTLQADGVVDAGDFLPDELAQRLDEDTRTTTQYVSRRVLARLRAVSLALLRGSVEPATGPNYCRFLHQWQHLDDRLRGIDGALSTVDLLAGVPLPASTIETLVLPARVRDYESKMLDDLVSSGEVTWVGSESLSRRDGWVSLHPTDTLDLTLRPRPAEIIGDPLQVAIADVLSDKGALFASALSAELADRGLNPSASELAEALWGLVWGSVVTSDSYGALRAKVAGRAGSQKSRPSRPRARALRAGAYSGLRPRGTRMPALSDPTLSGRWSLLSPEVRVVQAGSAGVPGAVEPRGTPETRAPGRDHTDPASPPELTAAQATTWLALMLERYGVVTSAIVKNEGFPGGYAQAYRLLMQFEETGACRRGYYIQGQGGAQFAASSTIDALRSFSSGPQKVNPAESWEHRTLTLSAVDPANPYGSVLPWPEPGASGTHEPKRNPGALLVTTDGEPILYLERGGKSALTFTHPKPEDPAAESALTAKLAAAARSLVKSCRQGGLATFTIETVDGEPVAATPWNQPLTDAGFEPVPRGLRLRRKVL